MAALSGSGGGYEGAHYITWLGGAVVKINFAINEPARDPRDILYLCDESSQVDDPFMAVAGLAIRRSRVAEIASRLSEIRQECRFEPEVKWSSAKRRRMQIHRAYAEYLAELLRGGKASFHIRFAPFNEYDHNDSGPRKRTDTVSKMYYQLILHRAVSFYGKDSNIFVIPDDGDCTSQLANLRVPLCAAGYKTKGARPDCVKKIEPRSSKSEQILQLLDVTLGALTAERNKRDLGDYKTELKNSVLKLCGDLDVTVNTDMNERVLNVWNVTPQKRGP